MATTATKPQLRLRTPVSATFPSEIASPMVSGKNTPIFNIKQEEGAVKTPITPPLAYTDFLKSCSPVGGLISPFPTGNSFKFGEKALTPSVTSAPSDRSSSMPSTASSTVSFTSSASSLSSSGATTPTDKEPPQSAPLTKPTVHPASPFARPQSARMPRRLHIPQSPYSPARGTPMSAASMRSLQSPWSPYSATASPREGDAAEKKPQAVSVRQVVTRTVTYHRTPLDPAPKGKRRKVE